MKHAYAAISVALLLASVAVFSAYLWPRACSAGNTQTSDAQDALPLVFGGASSDLWNLRHATGTTQMCYRPSGLSTAVNMTDVVEASSANQVIGYPHIGYGFGEFDTAFGRSSPGLDFPMLLSTFEDAGVLSNVSYSLSVPRNQPMDFAYDLWIEGAPHVGHRALLTDLEVMVWLYNQTMEPAGTLRGTLHTDAVIDGREANATWLVFATAPSPSSRLLVTYLLSPQLEAGSVSVQLNDFVKDAVDNYWRPSLPSYQLMGIELGTEFESPTGEASLTWEASAMSLAQRGASVEMVA